MILFDLYHLYRDLKDSQLSDENFLGKYRDKLSKVLIGCSFNPEHWILYDAGLQDPKITIKVAKFIVEELKIKDIRLAIRWSNVWKNGKIDFDYYNEIFQYFFSQDVRICLNIGPIKTMRWPEETIPNEILDSLKEIPKPKSVITSESELGAKSLVYLEDLLIELKKYFTEDQLNKMIAFQGDNEGFNNFGVHKWTTSMEFEAEVLNLISKYFPEKKIMINSAGRNNLKAIFKLINNINESWDRYIIGYNYYFKVPETAYHLLLKYFDNLWIAYPFSMGINKLRKLVREKGCQIEISELQGEPWEGINAPGNSLKDFQYSLIRSMNRILNLDNEKSVIRYWGIEDLIIRKFQGKTNEEHEKIFKLVRVLNS